MRRQGLLVLGFLIICLQTDDTLAAGGQNKAMACAACHGADGNSTNPIWPNLAGQHASYVETQLRAFKSGQRKNPNMSAMAANLTEQDMADIGDYYAALSVKIGTIEADKVSAGETLYRGGNKNTGVPACMACHGPNGAGNPAAIYPALRGQQAEYTVLQIKAYRSGGRTTDREEIMRTIAARMTEAEIQAVAKYVAALH